MVETLGVRVIVEEVEARVQSREQEYKQKTRVQAEA